jgi:glucosamine kinase
MSEGSMTQPILIGVDGGGSRCRVRARLADGTPLAEAEGGSANIYSDLDLALSNIVAVTRETLAKAGLGPEALSRCHVGLGLAGANIPSLAQEFHRRPLPILGTGTAYVVKTGDIFTPVGGWGFAVSDQGSGGHLGRTALASALLAFDRIGPSSGLTDAVLARFGDDPARLAEFAVAATPAEFGGFAPLVMDKADAEDGVAQKIVRDALCYIEPALDRLLALGATSIVLLGGLAGRYRPYLSPGLRQRIGEAKGDALDGALALAATLLEGGRR